MTLNTPHLMLLMLRTLAINLTSIWKWVIPHLNSPHLNYKLGCAAVHTTLKCSTTTLKVIRCLSELSHTSPPQLLNNVCQLEVSCLTHHFSAICSSDCEICLLEWADLNLTPKIQFDQNHHLNWSISHITSQRSKFKHRQISSSRVSRTTLHTRLFKFSWEPAKIHCWEWAPADLTLVLSI